MTDVPVRFDDDGLGQYIEAMVFAPEETLRGLVPVLRKFGRAYQRRLTQERLSGRRGSVGLNRVTGHLARTLEPKVGTTGHAVSLVVLFGAPYAAAHEFGGRQQISATTVRSHRRKGRTVRSYQRRAFTRVVQARLGAREMMSEMVPSLRDDVAAVSLQALRRLREGTP